MTSSSRFLTLTGLLAAVAQATLALTLGGAVVPRLVLVACGILPVVWARSSRSVRAGGGERFLMVGLAAVCFWLAALEITLLARVIFARGFLAILSLASIHLATLYATRRGRPDSAVGRIVLRTSVFAAITLATLTVVETATRAVSPLRTYELIPDKPSAGPCLLRTRDGRLQGVPGCGGRYVHREFPGVRAEINSLGLRDANEDARPPKASEASILVLGDSFAYGMGVELEATFQQRLGELLRGGASPARVYGAAMPGSAAAHQRRVLEDLAPLLSPDIVVVAVFEDNDLQENWSAMQQPTDGSLGQQRGPITPYRFLRTAATPPFWRTSSSLLQLRRTDGRPTLVLEQALRSPPAEAIQPLREALLEELAAIGSLCRELDADLVVLLIPAIVQAAAERYAAFEARHADVVYSRTAFHDGLLADLRGAGLTVIDPMEQIAAMLAAGTTPYFREGHWNARGHSLATTLLFEAVAPLLAARAGS